MIDLFKNINGVLKKFGSLKELILGSVSQDDLNITNALSKFGKELHKFLEGEIVTIILFPTLK